MTDLPRDPAVRTDLAGRNLRGLAQRRLLERAQIRDVDARPCRRATSRRSGGPFRRPSRAARRAWTGRRKRRSICRAQFFVALVARRCPTKVMPLSRHAIASSPSGEGRRANESAARGAVMAAQRTNVVQNARDEARRRLDDRKARQAVRDAFELFVHRLARPAAAKVRRDGRVARLRFSRASRPTELRRHYTASAVSPRRGDPSDLWAEDSPQDSHGAMHVRFHRPDRLVREFPQSRDDCGLR